MKSVPYDTIVESVAKESGLPVPDVHKAGAALLGKLYELSRKQVMITGFPFGNVFVLPLGSQGGTPH